jgi:hypothetical protein
MLMPYTLFVLEFSVILVGEYMLKRYVQEIEFYVNFKYKRWQRWDH